MYITNRELEDSHCKLQFPQVSGPKP